MISDEIEELSGRLKASRQRVADLERNVSSVSSSSQQYEKVCVCLFVYLYPNMYNLC